MLQGSNRLQRGLNYMGYIASMQPPGAELPMYALYDGAHDTAAALTSEAFQAWVFDVPNPVAPPVASLGGVWPSLLVATVDPPSAMRSF